jgi:hypothetical protein
LAFPKEGELTTFLWKNLRVTFFPEITPNISSFISKNQEIPELTNTAAMPCRYYGCGCGFFNDGIAGNIIALVKLSSITDGRINPLTVEIAVRPCQHGFRGVRRSTPDFLDSHSGGFYSCN